MYCFIQRPACMLAVVYRIGSPKRSWILRRHDGDPEMLGRRVGDEVAARGRHVAVDAVQNVCSSSYGSGDQRLRGRTKDAVPAAAFYPEAPRCLLARPPSRRRSL